MTVAQPRTALQAPVSPPWEVRNTENDFFRPATLALMGATCPPQDGYARLQPNGWVDFWTEAMRETSTRFRSFPPHRIACVTWLSEPESATDLELFDASWGGPAFSTDEETRDAA